MYTVSKKKEIFYFIKFVKMLKQIIGVNFEITHEIKNAIAKTVYVKHW